MRNAAYIETLWANGGPFIGTDGQPHSRVTVQLPWSDLSGKHKYDVLRTTYSLGIGKAKQRGIPLRWFQDKENDQVELEVPNVKNVHTTRSIDSDAAHLDLTIYNQQMFDNGAAPLDSSETGQPGYFSFNRGVSLDAQARWGQSANAWENILVPNALLRTYQGYGGTSKSIADAIADGNIILTGLWLVDTVEIHTDGTIHLQARDMAKLLIDQQLYPPLVPTTHYPLTYYRWQYFNVPVHAQAREVVTQSTVTAGHKGTTYETSSVDAWYDSVYGHNMDLHGHHPSDAFDGNPETYFLGEGNSRSNATFAVNYLQAVCGEQMNSVYVNPWAGNYTMYVSVMENGVWQGDPNVLIPYSDAELVGTQPYVVDTGANIPYVASFGVPWETAQEYILPRVYRADRVRISLRDLTYTEFGPWHYRGGIREFDIRASGSAATTTVQTVQPVFYAATSICEPANPVPTGYITDSDSGQLDAFGDARLYDITGGDDPSAAQTAGLGFSKTTLGYYELRTDGRLTCYGDAVFYGSPINSGVIPGAGASSVYADVCVTHTGLGYWITRWDGRIFEYGDAPPYTSLSGLGVELQVRACAHPTAYGLFLVLSNGTVNVRGAATSHGNWTGTGQLAGTVKFLGDIQCTHDGLGYWLMSTSGEVQAKGSAVNYGQPGALSETLSNYERWFELLPAPDDLGYILMRGDGFMSPFGTVQFFGGPQPGKTAQQRMDGNYLDYTDIIKDLALWSGFTFYDPTLADNEDPDVYGNLESTGAYSAEPLPTDMFDKKPVIDAMHAIKEVVGYLLWVDDEGAFRFESPNWWAPGNFDESGNRTPDLPYLDETNTLIDYTVTVADDPLRSLIIISSEDPDAGISSTITSMRIPSSAPQLRGLCKPAMWVNGYFLKHEEQVLMADLIALHINFQSRLGQVTCSANPALQINDQVRIWERQSADTYIHYVRGIETTHDLDEGAYTMTVTTNWMGDESNWAIQPQTDFTAYVDPDNPNNVYGISPQLITWLKNSPSRTAGTFGAQRAIILTHVVAGSQSGTGAAT